MFHQIATVSAMSRRDRAATQLSIETLRAKAAAASLIDAMRLRAAADRLENDLFEDAGHELRASLETLIAETCALQA